MVAQEIISLVKDFKSNYPELEQITFYSDISQEMLEHVIERFPEFDNNREIPLLFYLDAPSYASYDSTQKWVMLTDVRLYYYTYYLPERFNVLNYRPLYKIESFAIKRNKWIKDTYIELNGKKLGSLEIRHKVEEQVLAQFINLVLDCVKTTEKTVEEKLLGNEYTGLENVSLFTLTRDYFDGVNRGGKNWAFETFYYGPFIPEDKLEMARQDYANYDTDNEKPIIYIDDTARIGNTDTSGVVITNKSLYYKLYKSIQDEKFTKGRIPLLEIKTFRIKSRFFTGWMIINNKQAFEVIKFLLLNKEEAKIVEYLVQKFIHTLNAYRHGDGSDEPGRDT